MISQSEWNQLCRIQPLKFYFKIILIVQKNLTIIDKSALLLTVPSSLHNLYFVQENVQYIVDNYFIVHHEFPH